MSARLNRHLYCIYPLFHYSENSGLDAESRGIFDFFILTSRPSAISKTAFQTFVTQKQKRSATKHMGVVVIVAVQEMQVQIPFRHVERNMQWSGWKAVSLAVCSVPRPSVSVAQPTQPAWGT